MQKSKENTEKLTWDKVEQFFVAEITRNTERTMKGLLASLVCAGIICIMAVSGLIYMSCKAAKMQWTNNN